MSSELKPCPFCGGKAEITMHVDDYGTYYVVCCMTDKCRGSEDYSWSETHNVEEAIKAWNRRMIT